jgi:protein-tyrosine-phosphatase
MMAAVLARDLDERLGADAVLVSSSGFAPSGIAAIDDAVSAMARRGLDIGGHRSSATTAASVDAADLILTAERDHVVRVAGLSPAAYARAMTLPEFLERVADAPLGRPADLRTWVQELTSGRTTADYLRQRVPEIADPTGSSARAFEQATAEIERQCALVADVLARVLARHEGTGPDA